MSSSHLSERFRVPKTAELVADALRGQIIRGQLTEGQSLPAEAELTVQFGVSRPTLREAFRILESERLIEVRRGARGGAQVRLPDIRVAATYAGLLLQSERVRLGDVYEARTVVERPAVAELTSRPVPEAIEPLCANLRETEELLAAPDLDTERLDELALDFHADLVRLAGNHTLYLFSSMLRQILHGANRRTVAAFNGRPARVKVYTEVLRAHAALVEHIVAGDAAAADALWRSHLDEVHTRAVTGRNNPADLVVDILS